MTVMARSQGSDSALFLSPMHKYTEKEQQAIDGVIRELECSLPGYRKQFIFFNGNCVGYKWEKVGALPERMSKFRIWPEHITKVLKWNW